MLEDWQIQKFDEMGYDMGTLKHRELLIEKLQNHFPFDTLLDVGCATGPDIALINMVFPTVEVIGFDKDPVNILQAREKNLAAKLSVGDLRYVLSTYPDKSIDVVLTNGVIMYHEKENIDQLLRIARKAVVMSEKTPGEHYTLFLKEKGITPTVTKITREIRQPWEEDGFIYEIKV